MPYASVSEVPDYVPAAKRKQWLDVWNSAFKRAKDKGMSEKKAEASAFRQANGVAGPNKAAEGAAFELFIPIVKVDEETKTISGYASLEETDRDGEVNDYAASKPYIQEWSDSQKEASGGKSLGNVREQHSRISAGIVKSLQFDDAKKGVFVETECVDDSTWKKVLKGALTGFSWGGKYAKVWKDAATAVTRFAVKPAELSYVDRPAVAGATFQLVKTDGTTESREFVRKSPAELLKEVQEIVARVQGAPAAKKREQVEKCMYYVSCLADAVQSLQYLANNMQGEEDYEVDDSELPAKVSALVGELGDILVQYAEEEVEELQAAAAKKGEGMSDELEKAIKSHYKVKAAHHKAMAAHHDGLADRHRTMADHYLKMHGQETDEEKAARIEAEKADAAKAAAAKVAAGGSDLEKTVANLAEGQAELAKGMENLATAIKAFMEAPAGVRAIINPGGRTVNKTEDGGGSNEGYAAELAKAQAITDPEQRANAVMKVTHKYGGQPV